MTCHLVICHLVRVEKGFMDLGTLAILALTFFAAMASTAALVPPVIRLCERRGW